MPPKVMSGARGKLGIYDRNTGLVTVVGIFNNVSWGLTYDAQPVFILGRYSAAEIDYTAMEPVQVTASGWRVVDHGPHVDAKVPQLQDLLRHEYLELAIVDRQTNKKIGIIHSVRPTGWSTTLSARQLQETTVTFVGLLVDDESTAMAENAGSTDLP